jgi:hypothetical protein
MYSCLQHNCKLTQVADHVTGGTKLKRELRVALDLVEQRGRVELEQVGEEVQAPAMRHGQDDMLYPR